MKYHVSLALLASCSTLLACANFSGEDKATADTTQKASVEKNSPNTNYKPAFAGQTRIGAISTTTPYTSAVLAEGIARPWAIVPLPDGRLLITEKSGTMQIRTADGNLVKKITGLPAVESKGQGGLLDAAPDPNFASNKIIYWAYSEKYGEGNLTAVAKGKLSADETTIENPTVIFRATPFLQSNMHFGSRLAFDKEGYLFVTVGERSILEGRKQAQWLNSGLGKVFRITQDGKPAPGNPFANTKDAMPEIWSYGHRNPQSLAIHPVTGALWEAEFGPRGGDELNLVQPGKNYGWPTITYGIEYAGPAVGDGIQQKEGMEQPVYYWDPVVSPSGMTFYTGNDIPEWKNDLFIGCLSGMHIARLKIENNKVVGEERIIADKNERIRDVAYLNGKLYAITDTGKLIVVKKK
ncbi:MAG TPA: PQQ-dependent sugar dehydrogenase [Phnomibacter sp.]|nr:PQQ-dependent sugar dehydrogenase [Phnomibacter sp.]